MWRGTSASLMTYGQTSIQEDCSRRPTAQGHRVHRSFRGAADGHQRIARRSGSARRPAIDLACDFIAGCDGFHGVSRAAIPLAPGASLKKSIRSAGWGFSLRTPPLADITCRTTLAALHSPPPAAETEPVLHPGALDTKIEDWSDERFWTELKARFPDQVAQEIVTGPSIEKSVAPLRSFVTEPMRHGRMFLAGDAAHIVPPTGAKGLNLAVSDVYYLSRALALAAKNPTCHVA
jgi:p-hydroxybenzoate 3-monooxygenase